MLEELDELVAKAEKQIGVQLRVERAPCGRWNVLTVGDSHPADKRLLRTDLAVLHLRTLATPPAPPNVMISVPFMWAEKVAYRDDTHTSNGFEIVQANCRTAVAPYRRPEE